MIELTVRFDKPIKPYGQTELKQITKALESELKPGHHVVGIRLTSSKVVQELNHKFAGKDEPTDVLSFNYDENTKFNTASKQGDIVISHDHVLEQAKEAKTGVNTELALLVLHGILHILGYDHQNKDQTEVTDKLQAKIMQSAGLSYRNFGWKS